MSSEHRFRRRAEAAAWLALAALALVSRFAGLDHRAMSHDESLHAYYSARYLEAGEFRHDPLLHGPLLFHGQALVYALVGVDDRTSRLLPAATGVLLVLAPWLFRRELGRIGALAAAALLLLSPAVLFYSRYLRNDVWCALFALLWARALLDYRARGEPATLPRLAAAMALSFAAKEIAFLTGAGFGAWCLVAAHSERRRGDASGAARWLDLAWFQLALVAPYLSALGIAASGRDPADFDAPGAAASAALWGLGLGAAGLAAALARTRSHPGPRRAMLRGFAGFWALLLALYTSLGTRIPGGVASGVAGSLGYWLAQHGVERGGQPVYFYALLSAIYEPLLWALSLAAVWPIVRFAGAATRPARATCPARRVEVERFLAFWCAAAWLGYSWAGERMPWLLVHIVVPSALLAGTALDRWLPRLLSGLRAATVGGAAALLAVAALLAADLVARRPLAPAGTLRTILLAGVSIAAAAAVGRVWRDGGHRRAARCLLAALLGAWCLLGARTALRAAFPHGDLAVETLVYAHGTPDLKPALAALEAFSRARAGGLDVDLAYDLETSWPLAWYLRRFPRARGFHGAPGDAELAQPALVVAAEHDAAARERLACSHDRLPFRFVWWPLDGYRRWTAADLTALGTASGWRALVGFWFFREIPGLATEPWPLRREAVLYLSRAPAPCPAPTPELSPALAAAPKPPS